jgi:hypothetical protein
MRRRTFGLVLAVGTLSLGACESLRDAFSAQPDVVATAAGRRLSTERMLALMQAVPAGGVTREGAEFVANLWVDLQLFARARVTGDLASDSATVARVVWPQITQVRLGAWRDTLSARAPRPTEASADSAFDAGTARLFQHILVLPGGERPQDSAAARAKIARSLAQIRQGRDFAAFTAENNDMTKDDRGFLPVGPRGQFVPEFENVAWELAPGQVSDVVQSPFGWHIIRRTPKDEARARFLTWLETSGQRTRDSTYLAQLSAAHELRVEGNAGQAMKEALENPQAARRSSKRLVRLDEGAFTVADFMRWMEAFPPSAAAQIAVQPDSVLADFAENLAQNQLIMRQVDSAGIGIEPAEWQALQLSYRAMVDQLAAAIGLTDSVVADSTLPQAARMDSAASRVERLMDRLVAGQAQFRPLPAPLSGYLRELGVSHRVNQAGLARAMELYTAARREDSAKAAASGQPAPGQPAPGQQPPTIQPAPGPAPVPGGQPPTP